MTAKRRHQRMPHGWPEHPLIEPLPLAVLGIYVQLRDLADQTYPVPAPFTLHLRPDAPEVAELVRRGALVTAANDCYWLPELAEQRAEESEAGRTAGIASGQQRPSTGVNPRQRPSTPVNDGSTNGRTDGRTNGQTDVSSVPSETGNGYALEAQTVPFTLPPPPGYDSPEALAKRERDARQAQREQARLRKAADP
jgi:hypothetical protein